MTNVAVYYESADPKSMPYRPVSGRNQAMGRTAGEALDALYRVVTDLQLIEL